MITKSNYPKNFDAFMYFVNTLKGKCLGIKRAFSCFGVVGEGIVTKLKTNEPPSCFKFLHFFSKRNEFWRDRVKKTVWSFITWRVVLWLSNSSHKLGICIFVILCHKNTCFKLSSSFYKACCLSSWKTVKRNTVCSVN